MTTSVVSFVVRKGNPKNIKTWDDLLKPGIKVLTPNPFSSGAAKWNLLAGYGYASDGGKDPEAGLDYVRELITEHVKVQDKSGREALQNFIGGNGDVLLSYEYEAITANKKGEELEYVIPDDTIKINIDIATTKDAPAAGQGVPRLRALQAGPGAASPSWGYRPVNEEVLAANEDQFPTPPGLFTIDDLGGWEKVNEELFDIEGGSIAKIEEEAGVSTARMTTRGPHPAAPGRPAGRPRARRLDALAQPDRPAAAGRRRRALASRAASTRSGTRSRSRQAVAALRFTLGVSLVCDADQRGQRAR